MAPSTEVPSPSSESGLKRGLKSSPPRVESPASARCETKAQEARFFCRRPLATMAAYRGPEKPSWPEGVKFFSVFFSKMKNEKVFCVSFFIFIWGKYGAVFGPLHQWSKRCRFVLNPKSTRPSSQDPRVLALRGYFHNQPLSLSSVRNRVLFVF